MKKFLLPLAATALLAGCASQSTQPTAAGVKPYPLKVCIVSGDKLGEMGEPIVKVVNGREVKFCCKDCVKDFDKEPAKYLTKLTGK
jgi:nitrous oxide reductase accessory protein NosL